MTIRLGNRALAGNRHRWRSKLSPSDHWKKWGRLVRCDGCGHTQRTRPEAHREGKRLRNMNCQAIAGCNGRLRTFGWWERHPDYKPFSRNQLNLIN